MKRKHILVYTPMHEANLLIQEYLYENLICHCDLIDTMQKFEKKVREKLYDLIIVELFYSDSLYTADIVRSFKKMSNQQSNIIFITPFDIEKIEAFKKEISGDIIVIKKEFTDFQDNLIEHCKTKGIPAKIHRHVTRKDIASKKMKPFILVLNNSEDEELDFFDTKFDIINYSQFDDFETDLSKIYLNVVFIILKYSDDEEIKSVVKRIRRITILPKIILLYNKKDINTEMAKTGVEYIIDKNSHNETEHKLKSYIAQSLGNALHKNENEYLDWVKNGIYYKNESINRYFALLNLRRFERNSPDLLDICTSSYTIENAKSDIEKYLNKKLEELLKPKLLIVEDEKATVNMLKNTFKDQFDIFTAETGKDTIKQLMNNQFHFVLLDVKLPDVSTDQIYDTIAEYKQNAEVIVVTAFAENEDAYGFLRNGVYDYLQKPYSIVELYKKLGCAWMKMLSGITEHMIDIHTLSISEKIYIVNDVLTIIPAIKYFPLIIEKTYNYLKFFKSGGKHLIARVIINC